MYCVYCGVELSQSEKFCPLCQKEVVLPENFDYEEPLYPGGVYPKPMNSKWRQFVLTAAVLLSVLIVLLCDLQINGRPIWSGIVVGALVTGYVIFILPTWFSRYKSAIFIPCNFAVIELYLLYINIAVEGDWFLTFALPLAGGVGLIVTAVAVLLQYVRGGRLYIFGGAFTALGVFALGMEFLVNCTFHVNCFIGWSLYPLTVLVLVGILLIFLAICRPARESMERKFFI